ncbi:MAG TPA: FtsX-like permease family protein [Thermoleophilaceae bacterium]|nr:FtsX-like permease family protein [Thermoleophilaceae bacterium]
MNTLMMIAIHRTRELALLRLVGGTRQQVIAIARWEGGLAVTLGIVLGSAIALVGVLATQIATRIALRTRPVDGIGVHE